MDVPKKIGNYEIECLISIASKRRTFFVTNNGKKFAMKESLENDKGSLQKEYEILQSTNHPNIIKVIDYFENDNKFYLDTPRANIDLFEYMTDEQIPNQKIPKIFQDLFSAVSYLCSCEICHCNISADNILYYKDENKYVLAGFGNAFHFNETLKSEFLGHSPYIAPEIISNKESIIRLFFF